MHLNPWNSHVIKKEFHPYQLLLPVYRFFQHEGGEIEFDAEKFTMKIRKHPLRYLEDKLKAHDIDDGRIIRFIFEAFCFFSLRFYVRGRLQRIRPTNGARRTDEHLLHVLPEKI